MYFICIQLPVDGIVHCYTEAEEDETLSHDIFSSPKISVRCPEASVYRKGEIKWLRPRHTGEQQTLTKWH